MIADPDADADADGLRDVAARVDGPRAFDATGLALARWIADQYLCSLREALGAVVLAAALPRAVDRLVPTGDPPDAARFKNVPERLIRLLWTDFREGVAPDALLRHPEARRAGDRPALLRAIASLQRAGALERRRTFAKPSGRRGDHSRAASRRRPDQREEVRGARRARRVRARAAPQRRGPCRILRRGDPARRAGRRADRRDARAPPRAQRAHRAPAASRDRRAARRDRARRCRARRERVRTTAAARRHGQRQDLRVPARDRARARVPASARSSSCRRSRSRRRPRRASRPRSATASRCCTRRSRSANASTRGRRPRAARSTSSSARAARSSRPSSASA